MQYNAIKKLPLNVRDLIFLLFENKEIILISLLNTMFGLCMILPCYVYMCWSNFIIVQYNIHIILIILYFILFIVSLSIIIFTKKIIQGNLIAVMTNRITLSLWHHIMQQPTVFFKAFSTGNLSNKIYNYRDAIENNGNDLLELFSLIILYIIFILFIGYYNIFISFFMFLITLIVSLSIICIAKKHNLTQTDYTKSVSNFSESIFDTVAGMQKIILNSAQTNFYNRLLTQINTKNTLLTELIRLITYNNIFLIAVQSILILIVYCIVILSQKNEALYFNSIILILLSSQLITIILSIIGKFKSISLINSKLCFASQIKINPPNHNTLKVCLLGEINIKDLYFKYKNSKTNILNNINLNIKTGEIIGLIGKSGSGKSTLIRILIGFEISITGEITFDNLRMNENNQQFIRSHIGIVMQNQKIISGTIRDVISNNKQISDDELIHILKLVDFYSDLIKLPNGLSTKLKEHGKGLSGGQKQKLLIAAALIKNPKILILDEATSSIDNKSQSIIINNLKKLNLTTILVAHRMQVIQIVDSLYLIKNGMLSQIIIAH